MLLETSVDVNRQTAEETVRMSTRERGRAPAFHSNFFIIFLIYLVCEAIRTAATPGLLCQPRVIVKMIVEKQMECRMAGETEALGENLPQRHFCPSQNPIWPDQCVNPGRLSGKPATNRLSYGAALASLFLSLLLFRMENNGLMRSLFCL
jgi:hypothetical protein